MGDSGMLWAGRFESAPDSDLMRLTSSISFDLQLLPYDIAATRAHARGLSAASLLESEHLDAIDDACATVLDEYNRGTLEVTGQDEDVHSLVERRLTDLLGDLGRRIHAGRSRNDLVATDLRLWCRDACMRLGRRVGDLLDVLADIAETHIETVLPGYTHLQRAQPVSLGFHLMAHAFAFGRDANRFAAARDSADSSALGAGALAGTTLPLDATIPARYLGFTRIFDNAMDAVSDRDFVCDLVYACSLCGVHLSRLAEEIVLWTSGEFSFARLSDEWSTGSSMMPQKRNPDVAELSRGRAAVTIGDLTGLLALLKGLPLAYNRDLQEDKPIVFRAAQRTETSLEATTRLLGSLSFDTRAMANAAAEGAAWATDLAETLVKRGTPFREAHNATGSLVTALEDQGMNLSEATEAVLKTHHPAFEGDDVTLADPSASVSARDSHGGPAPERTWEQIARIRQIASTLHPANRSDSSG